MTCCSKCAGLWLLTPRRALQEVCWPLLNWHTWPKHAERLGKPKPGLISLTEHLNKLRRPVCMFVRQSYTELKAATRGSKVGRGADPVHGGT